MSNVVRTTLRGVPALWTKRVSFDCNGTLRAVVIDSNYQIGRLLREFGKFAQDPQAGSNPFGQLPVMYGGNLLNDIVDDGPVYVVYSYETPIAWVTRSGEEVKPPVKYSVTTSKHQGRLYHQS